MPQILNPVTLYAYAIIMPFHPTVFCFSVPLAVSLPKTPAIPSFQLQYAGLKRLGLWKTLHKLSHSPNLFVDN
jgi:hypothetical protein